MRSVALVALLAVVAAFIGVLQLAEPDLSATTVLPAHAAPAVAVQEGPKVTVRVGGNRDHVRIGSSDNGRGSKGRVQNPGLGRDPNRPGNTMLVVDGQGISLADQGTSGEGMLTRVHVDADDDLTAVIGFYSTIDAATPVDNPNTYSCKKCGGVLVCGVSPQCLE